MIEISTQKAGIYCIVNKVNNKCYVGQSEHLSSRLRSHKEKLYKNKHSNKHLQNAFNKYGEENFDVIILELLSEDIQKEIYKNKNKIKIRKELNKLEVKWIAKYKSQNILLYNQNDGGDEQNPNDEVKQKIGNASKERWSNNEYKEMHSNAIKNAYNTNPKYKEKVSEKSKNSWKNENTKEKRINGIKKSWEDEKIKEKRIIGIIKAYQNPVLKEKIKKERSNRFKDIQYKERFSKSVKNALNKPEIKEKLSNIGKENWKNETYRNKVIDGVRNATSKKEYKEKLSNITHENMKNPELRKRISETMKKYKQEKRKEIDTYNNILWMLFQIKPSLKKKSLKWKKEMVEKIAELLKNNE